MALSDPELRYRLSLFPLPVVLLPGGPMPLHIFEPRYRAMLSRALETDRRFGLIYHDWDEQGPFLSEAGRVGCVAEIVEHQPLDDGRSIIVVNGVERFRIQDGLESETLYFEAVVSPFPDPTPFRAGDLVARRRASIALFHEVVASLPERPSPLPELSPREELSYLLARTIQVDPSWHQRLLELPDEARRLDVLDQVFRVVIDRHRGDDGLDFGEPWQPPGA